MRNRLLLTAFLFLLFLSGCSSSDSNVQTSTGDSQPKATISELSFPETPDEVAAEAEAALAQADAEIEQILAASPRTFENTIVALDTLLARGRRTAFKHLQLSRLAPDAELRAATQASYLEFAQWYFALIGDADLQAAVGEVRGSSPPLEGEDLRLMQGVEGMLQDGGMGLDEADRSELAETALWAEYLKGVIQVNVIEGAPRSSNIPLLEELIHTRAKMARIHGYDAWSDLRTETLMAGSKEAAFDFLEDLSDDLEDRFAELSQILLKLKSRETGEPATGLRVEELWDYKKMCLAESFGMEAPTEERVFSYRKSLDMLFRIAAEIFGIELIPQAPPTEIWHEDVSYYIARDVSTGEPLGSFYIDPYSREGKDGWPRIAPIAPMLSHADGSRELRVLVLILDLSEPTDGTSPTLDYYGLFYLFHEFGHLLHNISGASRYGMTAPMVTPPDFLEVLSQLLEQWMTDPGVLEGIAAVDPLTQAPFSPEYLADIVAANQFLAAQDARKQIAYAMTDLRLYSDYSEDDPVDPVQVYNDAMSEYYFPYAENIDRVESLSHMTYSGYDSRYYSYQWSRAIAVDLAGVFKAAPGGFWDAETGRRLRRELFDLTAQRPPEESIVAFLGRDWNTDAYLDQLVAE